MTSLLDLQNKILQLSESYERGQLSKEEYKELLEDLDTSKVITHTANELEDLAKMNSLITNTISILSAVA